MKSDQQTGTEAPTKIHELLAAIKIAAEENGRTLNAIRLLLEKAEDRAIQQGQQITQSTVRTTRQGQTGNQRGGEDEEDNDERDEGKNDDAGLTKVAQAARRMKTPAVITFSQHEQKPGHPGRTLGNYPDPRARLKRREGDR